MKLFAKLTICFYIFSDARITLDEKEEKVKTIEKYYKFINLNISTFSGDTYYYVELITISMRALTKGLGIF